MGKKRSIFGVFKDVVEEDCESKVMKKKNQEKKNLFAVSDDEDSDDMKLSKLKEKKEVKKKSMFSVFKKADLDSAEKKEKVTFKFNIEPKESIQNHFTVAAKKKKPSPTEKDHYEDDYSSSEDEKEVIEEPMKKFSFGKEQDSPKKRISKEKTSDEAANFSVDSPRKTLAKSRRSITKMVSLSNSYGSVEEAKSPRKSSRAHFSGENSKSQSKSNPRESKSKKKTTKKKKDEGLAKIDSHFQPISIDDLLKLPEKVGDTGLTMDEILDKVDEEIREQKAKDEANMEILDQTIEKQRDKFRALKQRMADNAVLRDKLCEGLTRDAVKDLFEKNLPYLEGIRDGTIESARHDEFHKSAMSRQALLYKLITHPFTDDQVDWTYEEFRSRWMQTTKEFHQINEYVWKVMLPECFIKFYMDFFQLTKVEAETKMKETPMKDEDEED